MFITSWNRLLFEHINPKNIWNDFQSCRTHGWVLILDETAVALVMPLCLVWSSVNNVFQKEVLYASLRAEKGKFRCHPLCISVFFWRYVKSCGPLLLYQIAPMHQGHFRGTGSDLQEFLFGWNSRCAVSRPEIMQWLVELEGCRCCLDMLGTFHLRPEGKHVI